jgi:hypothetical protein
MFETGITVRSIYEPLKACFAKADAREMAQLLDHRGFDVVGVKDTDKESITRFVLADVLRKGGLVQDHAETIVVLDLISDATPLAKMFSVLGRREYLFVLVGNRVAGIVTRADLNKPPTRIYLFGLISLLEMHLLFWIREEFGDDWMRHVNESRLEAARKLFEQRRDKHQELDLCECLQICDKADLIISHQPLRQRFGFESKTTGHKTFHRVETLRDLLAHSQARLTEGSTWEDLVKTVAWLEEALGKSDAEIEKLASKKGRDYVEKFWSASDQ